jgi:hypothetical protein
VKKSLIVSLMLLVISSCYRVARSGPYKESSSNCGKLVLKPLGTAILTKCGEIMWTEKGSWSRDNDTIRVRFRNYSDHKTYLVRKGKLYQIVNDSTLIKATHKIELEE